MVSPFDAMDRQMDKELMWVVQETHAMVYRDVKTVRRVDLCKAIGAAVGAVLIEREGDAAKDVEAKEFVSLAADSISGMGEEVLSKGSDGIAIRVAEACVIFMQCRMMGMSSPYVSKRTYNDGYNPFANDGGFCNPYKLKMLDD